MREHYIAQSNLKEFISKRNYRLTSIFQTRAMYEAGLAQKIRVIGNENSPAVLYDDAWILNMYVHNFDLHFTDAFEGGNIVKTFKLRAAFTLSPDELLAHIEQYTHKKIYKVKLATEGVPLFLAGWNHTDKFSRNPETQYPVFAPREPKVYHTKEKAIELCMHLGDLGIPCFIV